MTMKALGWAFEQRAGGHAAKLVLIMAADAADQDDNCWMPLSALAISAELSEAALPAILAGLEEIGLVVRMRGPHPVTHQVVDYIHLLVRA